MTGYNTASASSPMSRAFATTDAAGASFFLHDRTRTSRRGRTRTATSLKISRWNSIDPLNEYTGNSLIRFIENDTINHFDNLGLITIEYRSILADDVVYGYEKQFIKLDDSTRRQIQHRSGIEVWPSETECFCKDKCGKIIKSYVFLKQKKKKKFLWIETDEWVYDSYAREIRNQDNNTVRIPAYTDPGFDNLSDPRPKRGQKNINKKNGYVDSPTKDGKVFLVEAWCRCYPFGGKDILLATRTIIAHHAD